MGEGLESKKEKDFRRWSKTNVGRKEEKNADFKGWSRTSVGRRGRIWIDKGGVRRGMRGIECKGRRR